MIFQHTWQAVLSGEKWQTRRLRFPYVIWQQLHKFGWSVSWEDTKLNLFTSEELAEANEILAAHEVWVPVQKIRTGKAIGRRRVVGLRYEHLQAITEADAIAEGCKGTKYEGSAWLWMTTPRRQFESLWNSILTKPGERWTDNPEVWVLMFELMGAGGD
jgi:hypothetical protein